VTPRSIAAPALAAILAAGVGYAGARWGALVAGGADSYGYVSQAVLWRHGAPVVRQEVVAESPWPDAAETWAPLGYRPSPHARDAIVPMYPPGLPLIMAMAQAVAGFCAAFAVVPVCAALTIWFTYLLGQRLFEPPWIALGGAALVAASPVFLYQAMNAMSDVPVTACWTLALLLAVRRRPLSSGLATAVAIAIRPNLAPLGAVAAWWLWMSGGDLANRRAAIVRFAVGAAPSAVGIAWLNAAIYESPITSGYGTTGDLYSLEYLRANVVNYLAWIADVETPLLALSLAYLVTERLGPAPRLPHTRALIGGTMAVTVLSYLFYRPFDVWWYLRFLLPMWPVMMLATAAALDGIADQVVERTGARRWTRGQVRAIVTTAIVVLAAWHHLHLAAARSVFDLGRTERRYLDVARFVAEHTSPEAVILSRQHSGSLRLYAGRLTLRYDVLDPVWLDRVLDSLQSRGRHPYLVLDGDEVDAFRRRFSGASRVAGLDWAPLASLNGVVNVYDPLTPRNTSPLSIASTRGSRALFSCGLR
jgi:hypothetical protein